MSESDLETLVKAGKVDKRALAALKLLNEENVILGEMWRLDNELIWLERRPGTWTPADRERMDQIRNRWNMLREQSSKKFEEQRKILSELFDENLNAAEQFKSARGIKPGQLGEQVNENRAEILKRRVQIVNHEEEVIKTNTRMKTSLRKARIAGTLSAATGILAAGILVSDLIEISRGPGNSDPSIADQSQNQQSGSDTSGDLQILNQAPARAGSGRH